MTFIWCEISFTICFAVINLNCSGEKGLLMRSLFESSLLDLFIGVAQWCSDAINSCSRTEGVSVNGRLSLCVTPAIDWQPVQGVPCILPYDSQDRLGTG